MVKNVGSLERRFEVVAAFHEESHHEDGHGSTSDTDNSPVPSSTFSDFNDASSKAETDILPSWSSSWPSHADDVNHTTRIADPQGDVHPDWILPSSPPSPPLRYDPRCRASSPETPSPLYGKWQKPGLRTDAGKPLFNLPDSQETHASSSTSSRHPSSTGDGSAPVSRTSSWLSSSDFSASSSGTSCQPSSNLLSIFAAASTAPAVNPPPTLSFYQQPGRDCQASTSYPLPSYHRPPVSRTQAKRLDTEHGNYIPQSRPVGAPQPGVPAWRQEVSRAAEQTYSTAISARQRPGLAKLSRFREPTSSGKKRVVLPAKHAHKRSCSIQWQQSERWQKKSRARLRDLLVLLSVMLAGTFLIWKSCFGSNKPSSSLRRQPLKLPHLATLPEPQRDTMVIYRVLGNDLPPRHEVGQTLRNLRFMLAHENTFSQFSSPAFSPYNLKIEKYYILNRITNVTAVESILSMFKEYNIPESRILNIPSDLEEYRSQAMRWDGGVATAKNQWGIGAPGMQNATGESESASSGVNLAEAKSSAFKSSISRTPSLQTLPIGEKSD